MVDGVLCDSTDEDSATLAFLSFIEREMARRPDLIQPLDAQLLADIEALVEHMEVELTEDLGEDAYLP